MSLMTQLFLLIPVWDHHRSGKQDNLVSIYNLVTGEKTEATIGNSRHRIRSRNLDIELELASSSLSEQPGR